MKRHESTQCHHTPHRETGNTGATLHLLSPQTRKKREELHQRESHNYDNNHILSTLWGVVKRLCRRLINAGGIIFLHEREVSEADIQSIIADVSAFFSFPKPRTSNSDDSPAELTPGDDGTACRLSYSIERLRSTELYGRETLTLCFVHELAHQALHRHRFMLFSSERWMHELAADIAVGLYAARHRLPTEGYKRAVAGRSISVTHPDGRLRETAVDYGQQCLHHGHMDGKTLVKTVTAIMPSFAYIYRDTLRHDWRNLLREIGLLASPPRENHSGEPYDSRLLKREPDTNQQAQREEE